MSIDVPLSRKRKPVARRRDELDDGAWKAFRYTDFRGADQSRRVLPSRYASNRISHRFARASTACSSTLTLGTASSFATFSASLWVMPFSQGQKMRAVGQTWVML